MLVFHLFIQIKIKLWILLLFPQVCLCSLNFSLITWLNIHNSWFGCCQIIGVNKIFIHICWCSYLSFNECHICTRSIIFYLVCNRKWLCHILELNSLSLFDNHILGYPTRGYKSLSRGNRKRNRFFVYVNCWIQLSLRRFTQCYILRSSLANITTSWLLNWKG